ncbi:MAG: SMP-30/gluconolactonase/LRE family protein [Oscillospiraceae bacterium]|jgi:sugar lactone lactonase YvrE
METYQAELILKAEAELAEGPVWHEEDNCLYWVNINQGELHRFNPISGKDTAVTVGEAIGTFAFRKDGGIIAALKSGIYRLDETENGLKKTLMVDPEPHTFNRFNDGKCDPYGRFLAGTMGMKGDAAFYSIDPAGGCRTLIDGVKISNGLGFSPDRKILYYTDSCTQTIMAYDYSEDGELSNPRSAAVIDEASGMPDGMTVDANGNLWIALFGGGKVLCLEPFTGKMLTEVKVPAKKVTCCTFGGPDYGTLYITTAWENSSSQQRQEDPLGGSLFAANVEVTGTPAFRFGK